MGIFTKKVIYQNIDVNELIDKTLENNFYTEFIKKSVKEALDNAIETLKTRLKKNDVEYNWYGHLRDYAVPFKLPDFMDILEKYYYDDLTAFYTLADEYLQKNEEYMKKKNEENKETVNNQ